MRKQRSCSSWARFLETLGSLISGLALIVGGFVLISWNESHGLYTAQALEETQQFLVSVPSAPIDPKNNLQPVYFNGVATTSDVLRDPLLAVSQQAIKLVRNVEMYQWQEQLEKRAEKNHYSYSLIWSKQLIKSSQFKDPRRHQNPLQMPLRSQTWQAKKVKVGDFYLPEGFIDKMQGFTILDLAQLDLNPLQQKLNKTVQHAEYRIYIGKNPQAPEVGDLKVTISEILPQTVSVIAQQVGNTIQAYQTHLGHSVGLLVMGTQPPEQIFRQAKEESKVMAWFLRLVSLLLMILGFGLILKPVFYWVKKFPYFSSLINCSMGLLAFTGGLFLWAVATALAWCHVRPVWSFSLMLIVFFFACIIFSHREAGRD